MSQEYPWTLETMRLVNYLTPHIQGKAFDPDWFLLRQRFEEVESERDRARQEYVDCCNSAARLRTALEIACGSGKFADPKRAAERILAAVTSREYLADIEQNR